MNMRMQAWMRDLTLLAVRKVARAVRQRVSGTTGD
jgi:hypothetical protein